MRVLGFFALISSAYCQVATPPRSVGFVYNNNNQLAKVNLDVYIDLICPDSREAWPYVKEVADHYGPGNVKLTVHNFPLPYHQNGFYASKATFVIHAMSNGTKTFDWIDKILLEVMSDLTDRAYHEKSDVDLLRLFAGYANDLGLNATEFTEKLDRRQYNQYEAYTRVMWKHACSRGVAGTPTYFLNGIVHPNIKQSWTLSEWKALLDPLLQPQLFDDIDAVYNGTCQVSSVVDDCTSNSSPTTMFSWISVLIFTVMSLRLLHSYPLH